MERERLVAHTREAVTKGLASGSMWHAATNAEHARPMLQVVKGYWLPFTILRVL